MEKRGDLSFSSNCHTWKKSPFPHACGGPSSFSQMLFRDCWLKEKQERTWAEGSKDLSRSLCSTTSWFCGFEYKAWPIWSLSLVICKIRILDSISGKVVFSLNKSQCLKSTKIKYIIHNCVYDCVLVFVCVSRVSDLSTFKLCLPNIITVAPPPPPPSATLFFLFFFFPSLISSQKGSL